MNDDWRDLIEGAIREVDILQGAVRGLILAPPWSGPPQAAPLAGAFAAQVEDSAVEECLMAAWDSLADTVSHLEQALDALELEADG